LNRYSSIPLLHLFIMRRAIIIVLDSVGIGQLPDAGEYGDNGADTLGNICREMGGLSLPHLEQMGLGNIAHLEGVREMQGKIARQRYHRRPLGNSRSG